MRRASKLEMKISENSSSSLSSSAMINEKKEKKPRPRNPLKDLNSTCVNPRVSGEARRGGGCFSFFASNSSSSSSRPQLTTPRSAPPSSRAIASKNPKKASNPSSENPKLQVSTGSSKPKAKPRRPGSKDAILGSGHSSEGKCLNPSLSFEADLEKNGCLSSAHEKLRSKKSILGAGYVLKSENSDPNIRTEVDWDKTSRFLGEMPSGSCLNSTPEKILTGFSPELDLLSKEIERNLSNTPNSNTTPPVQASISPEITCGSNAEPTPACFAAGHVITGVHDRRKCRPRGILTVGEGCGFSDASKISSVVPPVAEASIQWLSSPSENVSGSSSFKVDEASVNWFVSPSGDAEESSGPKVTPFRIRDSSDHGFWSFSPTSSNTSRSPKHGGLLGLSTPDFETTPSSGNNIRRTPTSGSSISPFSAIVRRAAVPASGFKFSRPHEERGCHRYGSAVESSPISGDSWSELNRTSTPSSYSKSWRKGILSPFNLDSMAEVFGSRRLSPRKDVCNISPPFPDLSFQFGCPGTPSNSIDLACFKKPSGEKTSKDLCDSELRISWRDGLVSRIFEMGELGYSQYLSEDEDTVNCPGEEKVESEFDFKCDSKGKSLALKEEMGKHIQSCSVSFEFPFSGNIGVQEREAKVLPPPGSNSCAESYSTDDGLISSGDSDWTLFYKNHLFEV